MPRRGTRHEPGWAGKAGRPGLVPESSVRLHAVARSLPGEFHMIDFPTFAGVAEKR